MRTTLLNIFWLGLKEIRSLLSDTVMVVFVIYAFTLAIQVQATGTSSDVRNASSSVATAELVRPRMRFPGAMMPSRKIVTYRLLTA